MLKLQQGSPLMLKSNRGVNGVEDTTAIPSQLNVAATWSRSLAYTAGEVAGREARLLNASKRSLSDSGLVDLTSVTGILLAPRVNILRDPLTGSFSQGYSEDPYLNGQLGAQCVQGIQDQGTMANSKQIGPSSSGASSGDANSQVDLQVLHEVYWAAHETLIEAGVATIMCSYAQVNGVPACQYDELMNSTLRGDFNFTGIVMSDWGATHSTAPSIEAGLDWEMGSLTYFTQPLYDQVYIYKNLSETYVDRAVYHVLSKYEEFGLLDGRGPQGTSTDWELTARPLVKSVVQDSGQTSYDIAVRSAVLLKNDGCLPLKGGSDLAVIGPAGLQLSNGVGFAERAFGIPSRKVPPLDAIRVLNSRGSVKSTVGIDIHGTVIPTSALTTPDGKPGLRRNDSLHNVAVDRKIDFRGSRALPANTNFQWTGQLKADTTGYYTVNIQRRFPKAGGAVNDTDYTTLFSVDSLSINGTAFKGYRLFLDGGLHPWSSPIPTEDGWDQTSATVYLVAGKHDISITAPSIFDLPLEMRLTWVTPEQRESDIQKAVQLAKTVDTPLVFAHANSPANIAMQLLEGFDNLIDRVAAVNPNIVVVLFNSDPVLMPWRSKVSSILWMGNPGQEGGRATASVLFGQQNPSGRLPVTYPSAVNKTVTRNPSFPERMATKNGTAVFSEGLNVGYRWYLDTNTTTLFPFGYGLSYTKFSYKDLAISQGPTLATAYTVSFTLTNTGSVTGVDVPQLYIGPPVGVEQTYPGIQFAASMLVDFDDIELAPAGVRRVSFSITTRQLSFWEQQSRSWVLAKGQRAIWIGRDAESKVLIGELEV